MSVTVMMIGDIVGKEGCGFLRKHLPRLRQEYGVDAVIANGENSAVGNGILPSSADDLFASGVDVITTGNHVYKRREIYPYLDEQPYIIRPANFPEGGYGRGVCVYDAGSFRIAVINLQGTVYMDSCLVRSGRRTNCSNRSTHLLFWWIFTQKLPVKRMRSVIIWTAGSAR